MFDKIVKFFQAWIWSFTIVHREFNVFQRFIYTLWITAGVFSYLSIIAVLGPHMIIAADPKAFGADMIGYLLATIVVVFVPIILTLFGCAALWFSVYVLQFPVSIIIWIFRGGDLEDTNVGKYLIEERWTYPSTLFLKVLGAIPFLYIEIIHFILNPRRRFELIVKRIDAMERVEIEQRMGTSS